VPDRTGIHSKKQARVKIVADKGKPGDTGMSAAAGSAYAVKFREHFDAAATNG
jgi:hypothetical protein